MTTAKKRILAFVLFLCLAAVSAGSSAMHLRAEKKAEKTVYVSLGDSIAAGYGLPGYTEEQNRAPAGSYQALLAGFLKTDARNYAVTGSDTSSCISMLNSGRADTDLKNADIISLSIGSNDLLLPFIQLIMEYFDIDPDTIDRSMFTDGFQMPKIDAASLISYMQKLDAFLAALQNHAGLHAQAQAFAGRLDTILSILHKKAPSAEIYVTNIYNPFSAIPKIGSTAEIYIKEINQAFRNDGSDYVLIDVHTPFTQNALTNVCFDLKNPAGINLDPHPSAEGHQVIADLLTAALKKAHAPKAASIRSVTSNSRCRLSAQISLPADADGYQILYSGSKNGTYQKLASAAKKTYRTNTKKLKQKKTYYLKVRSYKTIKGVTYYGKLSSPKKIAIK